MTSPIPSCRRGMVRLVGSSSTDRGQGIYPPSYRRGRGRSKIRKFYQFNDELPPLVDAIKAFFAGIPYQLSDKEKVRDEHYYHALLYTLLMAFGADVTAEESTAKGRSDIVLLMPKVQSQPIGR